MTLSGNALVSVGAAMAVWWKQIRTHLFGWLLTSLAISLGAPFWFAEQVHCDSLCCQTA